MTPRWRAQALALVAVAALASLAGAPLRAQTTEPVLDTALREQVLSVPAGGFTEPALEVTVFRPPGDGPFPLVVLNHGRAPGLARMQPRWRPLLAARELVRRGHAVVVPMRQGFSQSGGNEISGGCNVHSNGLQQAVSVRRTVAWLAGQPWADVNRLVVMGQSHGGLTTLAYGTAPHPGTRLLVNFAGGLRQEGCPAWQAGLVDAMGRYGTGASVPSLWFYGDNDSYFSPEVFRAAHQGYVANGGAAELVAFGPFGSDAHAMFGSRAGLPLWLPRVLAAMQAAGLPVAVLHALHQPDDLPTPPPSAYAALDQVDRVPLRNDRAREAYRQWLAADGPKAFAVHGGSGSWGSAWGGDKPLARAVAHCERVVKQPCRLYAVDDAVVWTAPAASP